MKFEVYVRGKRRQEDVYASTPEMAYRRICCFYMSETPITIRNIETNEETTFTRRLDNAGNLQQVIRH